MTTINIDKMTSSDISKLKAFPKYKGKSIIEKDSKLYKVLYKDPQHYIKVQQLINKLDNKGLLKCSNILIDKEIVLLEMPRCDRCATKEDINNDFMDELLEILDCLDNAKLCHRDIHLGNLMYMDGHLVLIDYEDVTIEETSIKENPHCLSVITRNVAIVKFISDILKESPNKSLYSDWLPIVKDIFPS